MVKYTELQRYAFFWCTLTLGMLCTAYTIAQPVTTFERTYADPNQQINTYGIYGMDQTFDDGYAMVGSETFGVMGGTHVIRTDLNGQRLWNNLYTDGSWDEDFSIIESKYGASPSRDLYWTTGIIDWWYPTWGLYHVHLTNVATTGLTNWTRHYVVRFGPTDQDIFQSGSTSLIELTNGEIVMAGWAGYPGSSTRFHLIKTSAAGNIIWAALYGSAGGSFDEAWCVRELPDGNLLVVGTGNINPNGNTADVMWMKINAATGAAMWGPNPVKMFHIQDDYCAGYSVTIDASSNQAIIVGEHVYQTVAGTARDGLVIGLTLANGMLTNYATFDFTSPGNGRDIFRSVCPGTIQGTVTLVGKTGGASGERALAMTVETGTFTPFWVHTYDGNGQEWAEFRHVDQVLFPMEPNAFAAAGELNTPSTWVNEYLARISPLNGQTGCEYTPVAEKEIPDAVFMEYPAYDQCGGSWVINPVVPPANQCSIRDDLKQLAESNPVLNDPFQCQLATIYQKRSSEMPGGKSAASIAMQVLPNPLVRGESFVVVLRGETSVDCKLRVTNLVGRTVFEKRVKAESVMEILVETENWSAGVYTLTLLPDSGEQQSATIVVY